MFRGMRGKWLLWIRRTHLYLSVFFAPLLLLFVVTGWAQTMDFDHSSSLMEKLSQVHTSQYFPTNSRPKVEEATSEVSSPEDQVKDTKITWPMKWLISAMSVALIISISLGLVLAFTVVRDTTPVWISLGLGIAVPVLLLALAHYL